jgi:hypothetical protein
VARITVLSVTFRPSRAAAQQPDTGLSRSPFQSIGYALGVGVDIVEDPMWLNFQHASTRIRHLQIGADARSDSRPQKNQFVGTTGPLKTSRIGDIGPIRQGSDFGETTDT